MGNHLWEGVLIAKVIFFAFVADAAAQAICTNPIEIGELRVLNSKLCVDIEGKSGAGHIKTYHCDGLNDQQLIFCGDGTIRNEQMNYCFTPGKNGDGNLVSAACGLYPAIPNYQKWRLGRPRTFTDNGGIMQVAMEIINVKSGMCMDVSGASGSGNIGIYSCTNEDDQYFFLRSRGKQMAYGRLVVQKSGLCLDVAGSSGGREEKNVDIYNCEDAGDQWFRFYENGEVVNDKSRLCLDVTGQSGIGNVVVHPCEGAKDQMWSRPNQYCEGEYCSFRNIKSGQCLDVEGSEAAKGANVLTYQCQGLPDQRFKWVSEKWVTPDSKWTMVGCNQNGKVTQQISNMVSYSETVTNEMSMEIGSTIEAGVLFGGVEVSTSISNSLSKQWTKSQAYTETITFTCENYDTDEVFTRGCMWQLAVTTKPTTNEDKLNWAPQIVKCTSNSNEPKCPPFTRCLDKECTKCEEMLGRRINKTKFKVLRKDQFV